MDMLATTPAMILLMVEILLQLSTHLRKHKSNLTFEDVIVTYLMSEDKDILMKMSCRYWGRPIGWPLSLLFLMAIQNLAKCIVNIQASKQWRRLDYLPHVSANVVKPKFFGITASEKRSQQIRAGMDFLFQLMRPWLSAGHPGAKPAQPELRSSAKPLRNAPEPNHSDSDGKSSETNKPGGRGDTTNDGSTSKLRAFSLSQRIARYSESLSSSEQELDNTSQDIDTADLDDPIDQSHQPGKPNQDSTDGPGGARR
ncbi:uncharacterized protein MELLADRAFT_105285 [Melampsora larici-populina 98AG31]|uniref:Uncharacterized protein n=1 Tax=Melampsora larici-populina (strain 98AG31 / pathotype 3-4-7) TaxID=747676 RepID=F4RHL5_MELLP|nr:uncharacterized protein MELLADRAFT_105285 [Melampsora larici-populina 98AG31]EGG08116.1 hypothetical protein MELLADRAFT_105285 [Melampsora larici-populina 98AG31]